MDALREDDHAVLYVTEMDPEISDEEVLDKAEKGSAILITADKRLRRTGISKATDYKGCRSCQIGWAITIKESKIC